MVQSQLEDKQFLTARVTKPEWLGTSTVPDHENKTCATWDMQTHKMARGKICVIEKVLFIDSAWCLMCFFFLIFNWECFVWPNSLEIHQPVSHTWKCFFRFFLFWQFLWQEVLMCWNSEDRTDWHHYPKFICVCFFHSKKKLCALYGKWTECLYVVDPGAFESHKKNDKKGTEDKKGSKAVWTNFYFYLYWVDESISANYVKRNKI